MVCALRLLWESPIRHQAPCPWAATIGAKRRAVGGAKCELPRQALSEQVVGHPQAWNGLPPNHQGGFHQRPPVPVAQYSPPQLQQALRGEAASCGPHFPPEAKCHRLAPQCSHASAFAYGPSEPASAAWQEREREEKSGVLVGRGGGLRGRARSGSKRMRSGWAVGGRKGRKGRCHSNSHIMCCTHWSPPTLRLALGGKAFNVTLLQPAI